MREANIELKRCNDLGYLRRIDVATVQERDSQQVGVGARGEEEANSD